VSSHEAMGGTAAKFSVSALMFDYVLTGPISAVSAGLYLVGLLNQTAVYFGYPALPLDCPLSGSVVRRRHDDLLLVDKYDRDRVFEW
jgi:hypothetical protein